MSTHTASNHPHAAVDRTSEALAGNPGGLNAPAIAVVGIVGVVLVYVIAVATQAWFYSQGIRHNELEAYETPNAEIQRYHADQQKRLNEVLWADHEKTRISVPLDKALEAYAADPAFRANAGPQPK